MKCVSLIDKIQNAMLYRNTKFWIYVINNETKNVALVETLNTLNTKTLNAGYWNVEIYLPILYECANIQI